MLKNNDSALTVAKAVYAIGFENNGTKNVAKTWNERVSVSLTDYMLALEDIPVFLRLGKRCIWQEVSAM